MRLKLFWKLGLSYLLLLLLALGGVYFYTARVVERNIVASTFDQLESLLRLAESRPPDLEDLRALREWTSWMGESGARITVIAADGSVLSDSEEDPDRMENHAGRPEVREALERGHGRATRYSETVDRNLVYLAARYDWGRSEPVILRVAEPLVRVNEAIAEVRGPMASVSLVVLLIGGALSLLFSRGFAARVRRLKELSQRVSEGDFRPAPVARDGDELSELAASLNDTAKRLSTTIRSLEEERNLSAAILSSMSEGVAVVDSEQRVLYTNAAFREGLRLGRDGDALKGRSLVEVARQPEMLAMVQEVLSRGERKESEIAMPGPPKRHFLVRAAPVGEEGAVLLLLDITDIRRLERVRRDFVANVSHELKTPLTAIQGFAETLLRGALDEPENSRRFAAIIRDHAARLAKLTEDLLKLSRIEAGKLELTAKPLDLREVIERCVEMVRSRAQQKKQTLAIRLDAELPAVRADPYALDDVLRNLLDNAIQYTGEGGHIEIGATTQGENVRLFVSDDGIGIPKASHERIFERFYRVDAARSREVGGTGLGLAITKHLVEAMGGRIGVESELGRGATFTVFLPSS